MGFFVYILAFLKNVIYGFTVFFTGNLTESADVLDVLALRFLMSFVVLWVLKTLRVIKTEVCLKSFFVKNEKSKFLAPLLLAALFEPVIELFFEALGISMTTDITAGVILSLMPITSCICESLILKEKTTLMQKFFLALGVIGVIYIAVNTDTSTGENSILGIMFLLLTVVSGALYLVFSRKSSEHFGAMDITYVSVLFGMVAFNSVNVIRHLVNGDILNYFAPYFNAQNMVGFVFLAVFATIISAGMNNFALRKMQASTMSAFSGVSTLVTIMVGVLLGGETLKSFQIIGLTLIIARMIGVSWIAIKKDKEKCKEI